MSEQAHGEVNGVTLAPGAVSPQEAARAISPYTLKEKVARLLWAMTQGTVFRFSFHNWYAVRAWMLRCFGSRLAPNVRVRRTVRVECPWNLTIGENTVAGDHAILYCLGPVTIGKNVTISQHAHVCAGTHDYTRADLPLVRPPIVIEDDAWIAADAFVGPGVRVGQGTILGARGCAFKDLDAWSIYGGNPAKRLSDRPKPI